MEKHRDQDESRPYAYTPLPEGDVIRYLSLEPGVDDEPLRCSIHTAFITDATYEAISYVWGSEIQKNAIKCDNEMLRITTNLHETLQRLRSPTEVRNLWADSICINQNDAREKGSQVANMSRIYSAASRVLIYMGSDPKGHGPKVASLLKDVHVYLQNEVAKLDSLEYNAFPSQDHSSEDRRWRSLKRLFDQPWFQRGWVVREAGLARCGLVIWGNGEFSWESLMWAGSWIYGKVRSSDSIAIAKVCNSLTTHMNAYVDRNEEILKVFFHPMDSPYFRYLDYMAFGRHLQFKDRRDGIYAFSDLPMDPEDQIRIHPDYTLPSQIVFRDFALNYLESTGDLDILHYVVHDKQSLDSEMPTWVPRWIAMEQESDPFFHKHVYIRGDQKEAVHGSIPHIIEDAVLKVRGIILDSIVFESDLLQEWTTTPRLVLDLWLTVQAVDPRSDRSKSDQLKQLINTLIQGGTFLTADRERWEDDVVSYLEELEILAHEADGDHHSAEEDEMSEESEWMHDHLAGCSDAKRFVITKQGYFGLAPAVARKGDVCTRLSGSHTLPDRCMHLLRATERPLYYKFVGPGWIYDDDVIMNEQSIARGGTRLRVQNEEQIFYLC